MKHIKLFEAWDQPQQDGLPALLVVMGDWSGILNDPSTPDMWILPSKYNLAYVANPKMEDLPEYWEESTISDANDVAQEIFSGDQNGSSIYYYGGAMKLAVDPNLAPEEIADAVQGMMDRLNGSPDWEADQCMETLEMDDAAETHTPEYLAHCRAVVDSSELHKNMIAKQGMALPNAEGPGQFMTRTVEFNIV